MFENLNAQSINKIKTNNVTIKIEKQNNNQNENFTFVNNVFELSKSDVNEIIAQFLIAKKKIKEIAIPTYYGDVISYVNGLKYA